MAVDSEEARDSHGRWSGAMAAADGAGRWVDAGPDTPEKNKQNFTRLQARADKLGDKANVMHAKTTADASAVAHSRASTYHDEAKNAYLDAAAAAPPGSRLETSALNRADQHASRADRHMDQANNA